MLIPENDLLQALEENMQGLSNWGFCLNCGNQQDECEPNVRNYTCKECGLSTVDGAEEILLNGHYE